jgi:hypothetical protein
MQLLTENLMRNYGQNGQKATSIFFQKIPAPRNPLPGLLVVDSKSVGNTSEVEQRSVLPEPGTYAIG